jgi:putative ABC transport system permease protein
MGKHRQLTWSIGTAVALAVAGAVAAYTWSRPLTVTVAPVERDVPAQVFGLGTVEAQTIACIGFAAGTVIVYLFKSWFPRRIVMLPEDIAALFGAVVIVCLLGSILGVRAALRVDAARALTG